MTPPTFEWFSVRCFDISRHFPYGNLPTTTLAPREPMEAPYFYIVFYVAINQIPTPIINVPEIRFMIRTLLRSRNKCAND